MPLAGAGGSFGAGFTNPVITAGDLQFKPDGVNNVAAQFNQVGGATNGFFFSAQGANALNLTDIVGQVQGFIWLKSPNLVTTYGGLLIDDGSSPRIDVYSAVVNKPVTIGNVNATGVNIGSATALLNFAYPLTAAGTGAAPTLPANTPTGATGGTLKWIPCKVNGTSSWILAAQ